MSQLQHSPGPFAYANDTVTDNEGYKIARLVDGAVQADGHLFAAAPTMLALLRVWADEGANVAALRAAFKETVKLVSSLDGGE